MPDTDRKLLVTIAIAAIEHVVAMGSCDDSEEDPPSTCANPECSYCDLVRAVNATSWRDLDNERKRGA